MFGNYMDFEDDPFFTDPFRAHRDHMRQMMRSFSEPMGGPFMPSITDGRNCGHNPVDPPALRGDHRDTTMNPFGMFDNFVTSMRTRMDGMHKNFETMGTDANTHSFSSSSVMTYSKVGNDPPKVFQASSSTRRAPGGVKETVRSLKDSESGLEKMSIGHHIQDRGHVVEKKMNKKTGAKEFIQDFQNIDESEAQSFDEEWQKELSKFKPSVSMAQLEPPRHHRGQQPTLAGAAQTHREQPKSKPKSILKSSNSTKE
ncbi:myeloid leukemia factor 1 isoform X2 [Corythoichthys intestinalis]|uniref:myeloid leukemia factor 1 isoform X2 n=1 Tax=Corythoichthys intestinalis TaxID=161448 RepID=UPI0025A5CFC5|nr:myeloid leukemia factor 1 isoform X2 [Corythoichthys intestinalis]